MFDEHDEIERDDLTPAQLEFAGALRGLRPAAPAGISRDRLLFEAGAAAARRSLFRWRAAAAVLLLGNATLMGVALRSAGTHSIAGTPVAQAPAPAPAQAPSVAKSRADLSRDASEPLPVARATRQRVRSADPGYLSVRDAVLRKGLSALPAPAVRPVYDVKPIDVEELLGT